MRKSLLLIMTIMLLALSVFLSGCDKAGTDDPNIPKIRHGRNVGTLVDELYTGAHSNTIVSHTSLNAALALLGEGAAGTTRSAIEDYLGADMDHFAERYNALTEYYSGLEDGEIMLANGLWVNKSSGIGLSDEYRRNVSSRYNAKIDERDFTDGRTGKIINKWCSKQTEGLIDNIVSDDVSDLTLIGANALYFNCNWVEPFSEEMTRSEKFTLMDGSITEVQMMNSTEDIYLENENATGFIKNYRDGLSFVGILPKHEGEFSLSEIDPESLLETRTSDYDVSVKLPKFKLSDRNSLVEALSDMGLEELFDPSAADLSNMASGGSLYVDSMIQKTCIDINELGTEAAAVTEFEAKETALPVEKDVREVYLNRPFAFAIYDNENDEFLFVGKIVNFEE